MKPAQLEPLLQPFLPLLQANCAGLEHLVYFDAKHVICWHDAALPPGVAGSIQLRLLNKSATPKPFEVSGLQAQLVSPANSQSPGHLALLSSNPIPAAELKNSEDLVELLFNTVEVSGQYMDETLQQEREINDLAAELAGRYEELNLVYSSESTRLLPSLGRNALEEIVNNAGTFMDVDAATLLFPEKGLELTHVHHEDVEVPLSAVMEK